MFKKSSLSTFTPTLEIYLFLTFLLCDNSYFFVVFGPKLPIKVKNSQILLRKRTHRLIPDLKWACWRKSYYWKYTFGIFFRAPQYLQVNCPMLYLYMYIFLYYYYILSYISIPIHIDIKFVSQTTEGHNFYIYMDWYGYMIGL